MIHISLFSGIGGFELAAEWMGWRNYVSCDINEFGNKVREYYWPEGYCHKDVKTLNYETINHELSARFGPEWRDDDIILTGGFPCQPYSAAGKRLGKDDERHLWPEMLRVISEVKPTYIVGENVRGLTNWNGGVVFEEVCADLENLGYEVQPILLPACAVGAPHRRDRVWFVAYAIDSGYSTNRRETSEKDRVQEVDRQELGSREFNRADISRPVAYSKIIGSPIGKLGESQSKQQIQTRNYINGYEHLGDAAYTDSDGQHQCDSEHEVNPSEGRVNAQRDSQQSNGDGDAAYTDSGRQSIKEYWQEKSGLLAKEGIPGNWKDFPTQSPICGGDDGLPTRLDSITFSKWRNESIKAYGNAIVPQVAYQIFKAICQSTSNCETFNSDSPTTDSNQTSAKHMNSGWNNSNDQ